MRRAILASIALCLAGCARGSAPREAVQAPLGNGTAALVGGVPIPASLVSDVARAQSLAPRAALDRLIEDALAALGARAAGRDREPSTAWALEATSARATTERVRVAATTGGLPTDAEVAVVTAEHWRDLDLPEQVRTIHAVVLTPKSPADRDAARALAAQLARVEATATSDEDFEARAKALPHGAFDVRVERLPAIVADGRVSEGEPGAMDPAFVRGAFSLVHPGDTSGVVESSFGWHVIRLIERLPPKVVPLEARREACAPEIYARRGHDALAGILTSRRASARVEIQPAAEQLMTEASPSAAP